MATDVVGQAPAGASPVTVADGATVEISGSSEQSATFAGTTGTLILENSTAFAGEVFGLGGSDALDLADINYGLRYDSDISGQRRRWHANGQQRHAERKHRAAGQLSVIDWDYLQRRQGGTIVVDPVSSSDWQTLDIGAVAISPALMPSATVMVIRTDTYGAYIWNGTEWQQLITATSMPAAFLTPDNAEGVTEIQIAPSNTNILYMEYDGYVFKSTNDGATWTETNFAPVAMYPNASYKQDGQQMAIDPNNPNVVYAGTRAKWTVCYDERRSHLAKRKPSPGGHVGWQWRISRHYRNPV